MTATKRNPKPITAHPMFPAVTALWSGTFLGLGSFALAPRLLEGPIVALGLPQILPAVAPPLGLTARVLVMVAMMIGGALLGFIVGRRIASRRSEAPERAVGGRRGSVLAGAPRQPLNVTVDVGDSLDLPEEAHQPLRRRALSVTDESRQPMPVQFAPLPWEDLDLESAGPENVADVPEVAVETFAEPDSPLDLDADQSADGQVHDEQQPTAAPVAEGAPLLQARAAEASPLYAAPPESLGLVQLVERLALAIAARTANPDRQARQMDEAEPLRASPAMAPPLSFPAASEPLGRLPGIAPANVASAEPAPFLRPADADRVVPLRPAAMQPMSLASLAVQADDLDVDDLGLDRFLRMPASDAAPLDGQAVPANPVAVDDGEDEADFPAAEFSTDAESDDCDDRYSSLLDMAPVAARHESFHIDLGFHGAGIGPDAAGSDDVGPVVVFPGQSPALDGAAVASGGPRPFERPAVDGMTGPAVANSPLAAPGRAAPSMPVEALDAAALPVPPGPAADAEEADRALRAALATLQRMTAQG